MTVGSATDDYSYTYADYDINPDPDHRPMYLRATIEELRNVPSGAAVLDAGCGGGLFSVGLWEAGYDVFGLDLSESGVRVAQARGVGRFEVGSIYSDLAAQFDRDSFEAIVAIEVIEHLYSPAQFAKIAHSSLVPGGIIIISTPYWGYFKNIVLALTNRIDCSLTALWEGGHIKHFSHRTLTELMCNAGFEAQGFVGCGEGWRKHVPGLWSGMLLSFRKPIDT